MVIGLFRAGVYKSLTVVIVLIPSVVGWEPIGFIVRKFDPSCIISETPSSFS